MPCRLLVPYLCASALLLPANPAAAQFIGTFTWQTQPYCNRVTINVTQAGDAYLLEGYDDLCGAVRRAPVAGAAALNPNGTVGLGLVIVGVPRGEPTHLDVVVNLPSLNGTWSDSAANEGTFAFNGSAGGMRRPAGTVGLTSFTGEAEVIGRKANGTPTAPEAVNNGNALMSIASQAYDGSDFFNAASIRTAASESWTPSAHGARIDFYTNANGGQASDVRVRIDHDGDVGIGTLSPAQRLDVAGNVRVGTGTTGCIEDRDGTLIAGVCASDARYKKDVVSFAPMLNKVAALRPVHFHWRKREFPALAFGEQQSFGLMAQEVEEILPELVTTDAEGYKAVNYSKLPLIALQAIKELKARNDAQNAIIERRLAELEARVKP